MDRARTTARSGLRLRASAQDGAIVDTLPLGTDVEVVQRETWVRVRTADGETGWVLGDYLEHAAREDDAVSQADAEAAAASAEGGIPDVAQSADEIVAFEDPALVGEPLRAHGAFVPALRRICDYAREHGVRLHVTSSLRDPTRGVAGAVVDPASMSNHHVGHAIDMNLVDDEGFYNSSRLGDFDSLPATARGFLDAIRADPELRWGGDFSTPDPVHIDVALNHGEPARFALIAAALWSAPDERIA